MNKEKKLVYNFWNNASCGEDLYLADEDKNSFIEHLKIRYELEPYILDFAGFNDWRNRAVLEIGIGLGADHQKFAESGSILSGVDLTPRAIKLTKKRLELFRLKSELQVADAEDLPFPDSLYDLVYSWGCLHHSPDTYKTIEEVYRVLKEGGQARIMIYHKYSLIGLMLWLRYGLFVGKPFRSLSYLFGHYLESPGTKAYSIKEAKSLFSQFKIVHVETILTHGDLLMSEAGQRHGGLFLTTARLIWPRSLIKRFFPKLGLFMLIRAEK